MLDHVQVQIRAIVRSEGACGLVYTHLGCGGHIFCIDGVQPIVTGVKPEVVLYCQNNDLREYYSGAAVDLFWRAVGAAVHGTKNIGESTIGNIEFMLGYPPFITDLPLPKICEDEPPPAEDRRVERHLRAVK